MKTLIIIIGIILILLGLISYSDGTRCWHYWCSSLDFTEFLIVIWFIWLWVILIIFWCSFKLKSESFFSSLKPYLITFWPLYLLLLILWLNWFSSQLDLFEVLYFIFVVWLLFLPKIQFYIKKYLLAYFGIYIVLFILLSIIQ